MNFLLHGLCCYLAQLNSPDQEGRFGVVKRYIGVEMYAAHDTQLPCFQGLIANEPLNSSHRAGPVPWQATIANSSSNGVSKDSKPFEKNNCQ